MYSTLPSRRGKSEDTRRWGAITEVVSRGIEELAGTVFKKGKAWFFKADLPEFPKSFPVIIDEKTPKFKTGRKWVARFEAKGKRPLVRIVADIGDNSATESALEGLIHTYQWPRSFSAESEEEAEAAVSVLKAELKNPKRKDFRKLLTVTIDPDDAKDFDDALSIEPLPDGKGWKLWIHIADVAALLPAESTLDQEARERSCSCYLPDRVLPMLPFTLTNKWCSLVPNEDRLTHTAEVELGAKGNILGYDSYPSLIHSDCRLTYDQADQYFEGKNQSLQLPTEVMRALNALRECSQTLRKRRLGCGLVAF